VQVRVPPPQENNNGKGSRNEAPCHFLFKGVFSTNFLPEGYFEARIALIFLAASFCIPSIR